MNETIYHQVDTRTGEIAYSTTKALSFSLFKQVREKDYDAIFFDAWGKAYPSDAPLLSDLKLFRQWRKLDRKMRAIDERMKATYN